MPNLEIIPFQSCLQPEFEAINREWVEELFSLEPFDIAQLKFPQETIIAKGGAIFFAKKEGQILGTVGLSKIDGHTFELIKMGVKKSAQGKGVGFFLGEQALKKAKAMGAKKVVLYSHSKLRAAIKIYQKLGFVEVPVKDGKYCRCDLKMEVPV